MSSTGGQLIGWSLEGATSCYNGRGLFPPSRRLGSGAEEVRCCSKRGEVREVGSLWTYKWCFFFFFWCTVVYVI